MKKSLGAFAIGACAALAFLAVMGAATTIVSVLNGGTGVSNPSAHTVLVGAGSSPLSLVGPGSTGSCFEGNGASSDPSFQTCPISGGTTGGGYAWGGSGYDGAITADGTTGYNCLGAPGTHNGIASSYLQATDCNATTFTVNSGVTVLSQQTRIFATQSITVNGTIRASSTNGGNATNGAAGGTAGSGGTAPSPDNNKGYFHSPVGCLWSTSTTCSNSLYIAGANGGAGASTTNGSSGGTGGVGASPDGDPICPSNGVAGAASGSGGNGSAHNGGAGLGGGTGATCSLGPDSYSTLSLPYALTWLMLRGNDSVASIGYVPSNGYSSGGGGGGGDGTNAGGGGGGAGANGGNGNEIILSSPTITIGSGGVLNADGSNGGTGGNGGSPAAGNAGGGGGGGGGTGGNGGVIVLVYHTYTNSGSVHANAGSGANGGTNGTHSGSGTDGADGSNGNNGLAGLILQIPQ